MSSNLQISTLKLIPFFTIILCSAFVYNSSHADGDNISYVEDTSKEEGHSAERVIESKIRIIVATEAANPGSKESWWPEYNFPHYNTKGRELIHVACFTSFKKMEEICNAEGGKKAYYWTIALVSGGQCGQAYRAFYCAP